MNARVVRVAVIQHSKLAGMSLHQIRALLDSEAKGRHDVLTAHLVDLDERAASIERSRAVTEHALRCRAHDIAAERTANHRLRTTTPAAPALVDDDPSPPPF